LKSLFDNTEKESVIKTKYVMPNDNFTVEYETLPYFSFDTIKDSRQKSIRKAINEIDAKSEELENKISKFNEEIERLTSHADGFDYAVAVSSGVLCGLIDSFFVGEFDFKSAKAKSNMQVNKFIGKFAKMQGYEGERLDGAIAFLEKKFPVTQDNIWKGADIGVSAKNHHLDDFAHHPTLLGLGASVLVQFSAMGIFVNKDGKWNFEFISTEPKELLKIWLPVIISGLLLWIVNIVEAKYQDKIDEKIPKPIQKLIKLVATTPMIIPILKVAGNWAGHLVSDMGGSKNTAGGGMGIPGLFISLLHEISSLPILKDTELPKLINDLYVKEKFDMRSELAVLNELGRQAIPVLIGEVLVRGFYFVRRLVQEANEHGSIKNINWKNVIPFNNRTIARMMTIETGTFTAIDLADAAIRSAIESGPPITPAFWSKFVLKVNFVGVGRFAIAVGVDAGMGVKRQKLLKERMQYKAEDNMLQVSKIYYLQENMWIEADNTEKSINEMYSVAENSLIYFTESWNDISKNLESIQNINLDKVEENNPDLIDDLINTLEWN
jgi:hypothetical protein